MPNGIMRHSRLTGLLLLPLAMAAAGCQDLLVENLTDPDRRAALSEAAAVENLIASSWVSVWSVSKDNSAAASRIPGYADEGTSNHRNLSEYTREPRQAFANTQTGDARLLAQAPWYGIYEGAANAMDGLFALQENDIQLSAGEGAKTPAAATERAKAFAWLNHGILYGYLAMIFDQASTADLNTDLTSEEQLAYRPYPEVQQFAIESLQKAIATAEAAPPFQTPASWMGGVSMNNKELARLANSYIARILVYTPRNPAERKAVDWARVARHVDAGITKDFIPQMTNGGLSSSYFQFLQQRLAQRWSVDYRLIGPADISGRYAAWAAAPLEARDTFDIVTPDRRIAGVDAKGNIAPRAPGKYIHWAGNIALNEHNTENYLYGRYKWQRFYQGTFPWREGPSPMVTTSEMNLLKAEALLRTGNPAGAAALINRTRVANGELPPVTAAGIPGDLSSCVPRTQDGQACGTLVDALHYERLIEGMGLDMWLTWFNRRGFGTLQEGTFEHLPVPARELEAFRRETYTFGGGGPFSANANQGVE